ncbi:MAG: SGNH/GDSL hydrolase family protein [Bacteroidales bacterium]|nr:SGNH/GDSL hydrolase family protein [Bacteroidales bacterium]MCM1146400.1 SGNH/GDSL hydrolase family protein [Bacteroidales bacterium]MCM1205162.1 SGNH/GDSL hydrolase family protein [Bacillota bacterium]MCM1509409.1 SGNH/GDSL hydrolase family protein [Clostridium sp.]
MKKTLIALFLFSCLLSVMAGGRRFLFIGDSITDGGWGRSGGSMTPSDKRNHKDLNHIYGHSFMMLCAARWQSDYPEVETQFFNRGISGNALQDLKERWEKDALSLRPDVVTILVGTNDVSLYLEGKAPLDFSCWEADYRELLSRLREKNPDVQLILCTPFVAKAGKTGTAEDYARRKALVGQCAQTVRKIASDSGALLLDYEEMFDSLTRKNPSYWVWDGIHPTAAGHQRMADLWLSEYALLNGSSSAKE